MTSNINTEGEVKLWKEVILQAVADATLVSCNTAQKRLRNEAQSFLFDSGEQEETLFALCSTVKLDAREVRRFTQQMIEAKKHFNHKKLEKYVNVVPLTPKI